MNKLDASQVKWRPKGWEWVDPLKDQQAQMVAINTGMASRTDLLAKQGENFEEMMDLIAYERDIIKQKGLTFDVTANPSASKMGANPNPQVPGVNAPITQEPQVKEAKA